jgi:hypothetical protein
MSGNHNNTTTDTESIRKQMWETNKTTMRGLCAMCDTCGGSSITWCECAYARFHPTQNEIKLFLKSLEK